jgi:hypothetical protein
LRIGALAGKYSVTLLISQKADRESLDVRDREKYAQPALQEALQTRPYLTIKPLVKALGNSSLASEHAPRSPHFGAPLARYTASFKLSP